MAIVLLYEIIFSPKHKVKGAHQGIIQLVREHATRVSELLDTKEVQQTPTGGDWHLLSCLLIVGAERPPKVSSTRPRYARVNTLRTSVKKAMNALIHHGLSGTIDPFIPELIHLPPSSNLHGHKLVKKGAIFIQDRCSCLPVASLNPHSSEVAIDACAAPGPS